MEKYLSFLRNRHEDLYKIILFLLSAVIIVYLFPREAKFKFEYSKGKPWMHETIIAPFDFAIKKSQEEIGREEAGIRQNNLAYFRYDTTVLPAKTSVYTAFFASRWTEKYSPPTPPAKDTLTDKQEKDLKDKTYKTGIKLLEEILNRGIIKPDEVIENKPESFTIALLDSGNVAEEKQLGDFFTIQSAYNYIQQRINETEGIDRELLSAALAETLSHNVIYDRATSQKLLEQQLAQISTTRGMIQKGERVIAKGQVVDDIHYNILESYKEEYLLHVGSRSVTWLVLLGQLLLVSSCFLILFLFLYHFRKDIISNNQRVIFMLLLILCLAIPAILTLRYGSLNIYALPFCILPIIIRAFYDTRLASFTFIITCLIIGFIAPNGFEFVYIQVLAGSLAIFSIVNMRMRSQFFITALVVFISYMASYLGFVMIQEGSFETITYKQMAAFAISSVLTLFAYPLIFLFEKMFGFVSDVTLLELSDTNAPLLRELSLKAPGTFQHSLQVANLAETAIFEIGGDALLVRTGALYHDIGKMDMPLYFIENQATGVNPHDELSFEESAEIIISHVIKGVEKAKKYKIPDPVIDFIRTHHGDTTVQYFYKSSLKHMPDHQVDESKFRYPGPRPYSKETAVLMMADSVEAASRSLTAYDSVRIDALVENIINTQIEDNQFANANITFKDINVIKKIFKKKLQNIYHVRMEYPK